MIIDADTPTEGSRGNGDRQSVTAGKDRHDDPSMAVFLEWLSWHGAVLHPYVDRTVVPLVSWADLGMRLS
jgi:hypothetical protein